MAKLVSDFTAFLNDTVNLNKSRIDTLEANVEALKTFVANSDWGPEISSWFEQGSWAHETIIKPVELGEFDADLLVMVRRKDGWSAADYVNELGRVFKASDRYADKTKIWDYCITITYAGYQQVDIAPCVVNRLEQGKREVCNRSSDEFEETKPRSYTEWIIEKNRYSGGNSFRKATRLLKYMRDIKRRFKCSSVMLTTLLGNQIEEADKGTEYFADVPSALQTLMGRLDDYLQQNPSKPRVENSKLHTEDFAAEMSHKSYRNFRKSIHRYRNWIDDAVQAVGRDASVRAWRKVFGDQFAKDTVLVENAVAGGARSGLYKDIVFSSGAHVNSLVDKVIQFGVSSLPVLFNRPPYLQEPEWEEDLDSDLSVEISASHHITRFTEGKYIYSGQQLPASGEVRFEAKLPGGQPLPAGYRVEWRVANTGSLALSRKQERGQFYPPTYDNVRWEPLAFRGVHFVEAFVIRLSDDMLVATSKQFYVVIA